ncbi:MAG: bifunctional folylpolyglutamate synthase/dihydrofolate synthase [Clostridia bacterium]|nr:bifunctional folylpolyglutamate synthase/dihydrofolate synthase [Clostridia bacterium]
MTYEEALEYIHSRIHLGSRKGLRRIRRLMEKLGDPQKKMRFIHIAGSNGKGSTAAMCESVLRRAGWRTGLFVSPYVFDFRERMQINGRLAEKEDVTAALEALIPALDEMRAEDMECTEFETVTALAILLFLRCGCEIVVFEVGIGGLLDCTNVIDAPLVAVLTSVSLEHTDILGDTISLIAEQKCGIIKPGSRVAAYCDLPPEALEQLRLACHAAGAEPNVADMSRLEVLEASAAGSRFRYKGEEYRIRLAGRHQIYNALTAIAVTEELAKAGFPIPAAALREGLERTELVGRLQTVRETPHCLIDGAHNPKKIESLCEALDELYSGVPLVCVMGMLKKKDYGACIPMVARRCRVFIAVTPDAPLTLPAEETAAIAREYCADVRVCTDAREAGRLAVSLAREGELVLACGSLYFLSEAKEGFTADI